MCRRAHVTGVDYPTDDTYATVHVRHSTTDRVTRAIPTRGLARPRVQLADSRITNLCARRSLCYRTRAGSLHVFTPAHVCIIYFRPVRNLTARAGRYTTDDNVLDGTPDFLQHTDNPWRNSNPKGENLIARGMLAYTLSKNMIASVFIRKATQNALKFFQRIAITNDACRAELRWPG